MGDDIKLRPEDEFLLCCARTKVDSRTEAKMMSLAQDGLDWDYLIGMASKHRLLPLLYYNVNSVCPADVPEDVLNVLRDSFQANVRRNLLLTGELFKILELLKSNDIKAIPYKGPVLAHLAYKNIGFRQITDLDFLIDKSDALKVKEIMLTNGYELDPPLKVNDSFYVKFMSELRFINRNNIIIEIKWKFEGDWFYLADDPGILLGDSHTMEMNGQRFNTFSAENQLLILCVHSAKHDWGRLAWICDICEFIKTEKIDWQAAIAKASKLGVMKIMFVNLYLAEDLLHLQLPDEIVNQINSDSSIKGIFLTVKKRIFIENKGSLNIFEKFIFDLRKREKLIYAVKDLTNSLTNFTVADFEDVLLPESLYPLYYLIRPILLLRRYGRGPI